ncbi:hypothetical protein K438DRAFT_2017698 [Mycena galopus ATCC 62051]|nr:hypothetical protein K438DRAFT_2017698 [Mycena galopus ATCC 62051]
MMSVLLPQQTAAEMRLRIGGWDLAIWSALFLQGVLYAQFAHYLTLKKRDSIWLKFFVVGLALMTTLKGVQALALMWIQNVILYGNLQAASDMFHNYWAAKIIRILEATIAFYVQMFFCRRLWILCRNPYIVISCIALFTLGLVSAVVATFFIFTNSDGTTFTGWVTTHLGIALSGDLLLTGSTVFWLLRHGETVLSGGPTETILNSLIRVTVQSAAPAALCASITFVVTIQYDSWTPASVMIDCIMTMVLPQLYAWSAMWALNSRDGICSRAAETYSVHLGTTLALSDPETCSSRSPTIGESGTEVSKGLQADPNPEPPSDNAETISTVG